jgi:hypothetical protein
MARKRIDVVREFIEVSVTIGQVQAESKEETRRFSSLNEDLERMHQWVVERGWSSVDLRMSLWRARGRETRHQAV